jgi:hypothetical protein
MLQIEVDVPRQLHKQASLVALAWHVYLLQRLRTVPLLVPLRFSFATAQSLSTDFSLIG